MPYWWYQVSLSPICSVRMASLSGVHLPLMLHAGTAGLVGPLKNSRKTTTEVMAMTRNADTNRRTM